MKSDEKRFEFFRWFLIVSFTAYLLCLPRQLFYAPYATVVTDRNGELLGARIADDGQWRFPPIESVPTKFSRCIVQFEDRYFYRHCGVNPLAIARALKQNIASRRTVSGGSTLTMQLVRLSRRQKRTLSEKLVEIILATRLECRYSKSELLALYASHAPFGGNVVGLEAAAWRYFGRPAEQLSWAEAATLAVLPNAPAIINPSKNRDALLTKRNRLLRLLLDEGAIDKLDYELAISEPLPAEPLPLPQTAPHLVAACATNSYDRSARQRTVKTSIDKDLQISVENVLEQWHERFAKSNIRNLAAVIIDVRTNRTLAYCGNVDFYSGASANQVDIVRSPRSTGSILKPFLYYAALRDGVILPNTLLPDIPLNIDGFSPQNFNMQYDGAVAASQVIARSLNVPSVWLLREYGTPRFYDFLKNIGITSLTKPPSHYGLSLILGGAEATLWDVTNAYASMANALQETTENPNKQQKTVNNQKQLWEPAAVWQVFEALKEVNRPEEIDRRYVTSMQTVAWKTGTSYGFRDAWAVGVTSRYAVGVWVGNANGEGKPELIGARTAAPVMFALFNLLPTSPWFAMPDSGFTQALVCQRSGHLANRYCDETLTATILPQGLHTLPCPYHSLINTTPDVRFRLNRTCINAGQLAVQHSWFTLPPVWEWYYKQHHPEYKPLPPFINGCSEDETSPMAFIYPQANARVYLPRQLDGSDGGITLELAHSNPHATVFWHLDDAYLGSTTDFHKTTIYPARGKHSITVVDNVANSLSVTLSVE
jgi:penicillin-binding protein 1C